MSARPMAIPSSGESTMKTIGLTQPRRIRAPKPALAMAAPP